MSSSKPQTQPPQNTLPPLRRIVVSNLPIPSTLSSAKSVEPAVRIDEHPVERVELLEGWAGRGRVGGEERIPTRNYGLDINIAPIPNDGIVIPNGANVQWNELAPGGRVPMHRTQSTDYAIFVTGEVVLITPGKAYDSEMGSWREEVVETVCRAGDVLVQRGTLHAWENRTNEWVRFVGILLGSEPNSVEVEGEEGGKRMDLPAVFDV